MKLNKKEENRDLVAIPSNSADGKPGFLISENIKYLPYGARRKKWDTENIWMSLDELKKLLASVEG